MLMKSGISIYIQKKLYFLGGCTDVMDTGTTCPGGPYNYWYYNSASRQCEPLLYGGCGGNGNRYQTEADCEGFCETNSKFRNTIPNCQNKSLGIIIIVIGLYNYAVKEFVAIVPLAHFHDVFRPKFTIFKHFFRSLYLEIRKCE